MTPAITVDGNITKYSSYESVSGCGQVNFADAGDPSVFNKLGIINPAPVTTIIVEAHKRAYSELVKDLTPLAKAFVLNQKIALKTPFSDAAKKYQNTIAQAVLDYSKSGGDIKNGGSTPTESNMKKDGWMLAGTYFMAITNKQSIAAEAASNVPSTNAPMVNSEGNAFGLSSPIAPVLVFAAAQLSDNNDANKMGIQKNAEGQESAMTNTEKYMSSMFTGIELDNLNAAGKHPIVFLSELGDHYIKVGVGIIATMAGLSLFVPASFGVVQGFISAISPVASMITLLCWTIGFSLSHFLTALPMIIWFGSVVSWFIFVCEAMVGITILFIMASSVRILLNVNSDSART